MIQLKKLNADNWLEVANLSVSSRQKEIFPIPNVYWIGISRYEEYTTLFSIMLDEKISGIAKLISLQENFMKVLVLRLPMKTIRISLEDYCYRVNSTFLGRMPLQEGK